MQIQKWLSGKTVAKINAKRLVNKWCSIQTMRPGNSLQDFTLQVLLLQARFILQLYPRTQLSGLIRLYDINILLGAN